MTIKILLTGGGTAGHIIPNLALIESLIPTLPNQQDLQNLLATKTQLEFHYIGTSTGMEKQLVQEFSNTTFPIIYHTISAGKLRRYFSWQNFTDLFKFTYGIFQSIAILLKIKPNIIFSKGGFVSLPVSIASFILRPLIKAPLIIHESDSLPGLTTKLTKPLASEVWNAFNPTSPKLPIRQHLFHGNPNHFFTPSQQQSKPTLLIMGGSLGASILNSFVQENFHSLLTHFNLIHITGKGNHLTPPQTISEASLCNYHQLEFADSHTLAHIYASTSLVLSRAGANSISELLALNKQAILIPLPKTQSRGEQLLNAQLAQQNHPKNFQVIQQADLTFQNFFQQNFTSNLLNTYPKSFASEETTEEITEEITKKSTKASINASKNSKLTSPAKPSTAKTHSKTTSQNSAAKRLLELATASHSAKSQSSKTNRN